MTLNTAPTAGGFIPEKLFAVSENQIVLPLIVTTWIPTDGGFDLRTELDIEQHNFVDALEHLHQFARITGIRTPDDLPRKCLFTSEQSANEYALRIIQSQIQSKTNEIRELSEKAAALLQPKTPR